MVPAENLSKQHHHHHHLIYSGYGGCGASSYSENFGHMSRIQGYDYSSEACLGSDLVANPMAEDESRTNSLNEAGSSSKENQEERDDGWLQLSIGSHTTSHDIKHHQVDPTARRGGLIELDLLPGGSSQQARPLAPTFHVPEFRNPRPVMNIPGANSFSTSLFFQQQGSSSTFPHHQEINWAFRPIPQNIAMAASSSSSSSSLMPFGSYFARPFQVHTGIDVAGPSSDFRIIDPPRRPHSGIWFMLLASQNQ